MHLLIEIIFQIASVILETIKDDRQLLVSALTGRVLSCLPIVQFTYKALRNTE